MNHPTLLMLNTLLPVRRTFRRLFRERTEHVAGLSRVLTEAWWDGRLLLVEHDLRRRDSGTHQWPDEYVDDGVCSLTSTKIAVGDRSTRRCVEEQSAEAAALRRALALHDAQVEDWFALDEAACANVDD